MSSFSDSPQGFENQKHSAHGSNAFGETQWSLVINAGHGDGETAMRALERLCHIYKGPIYSFIRWKSNHDHHAAEDLTQSFFMHLLENEALKKVEREKGKFRTFLLASLQNFLSKERERGQALKRGGGAETLSLNDTAAGPILAGVAAHPSASEKYYDREWALALSRRALGRLEADYEDSKQSGVFSKLKPFLTEADTEVPLAKLALALQKNEGAVKVALHRLRRRFGAILREEVGMTVSSAEEIPGELRHLFSALAISAE